MKHAMHGILSLIPVIGIIDRRLSHVDTCYVVGTAHFPKYCRPVIFPPTVST